MAGCRYCRSDDGWDQFAVREMMFGTRESFEYERCRACGSLRIQSVPEDLDRHYPFAYYANTARVTVRRDPVWRRPLVKSLAQKRLFRREDPLYRLARRLAELPEGIKEIAGIVTDAGLGSFHDGVLDVGSGAQPYRLALFAQLGFERLLGIEPFIQADRTYLGVRIQKGRLEDVRGTFSLIMFHHSLEHVEDPEATLQAARERLEPNGRCLVRTPIADGALWDRYRTDWVELDAPRHLTLGSMIGYERLCERMGFEIINVKWESGDWEFIASEQYQRDIGMYEPTSWFVDPSRSDLDPDAVRAFRDEARRLNETASAGRAAIWLRPTG